MSLPVNKVSTADFVCAARGWHMRAPRPVFDDPYAKLLCGRPLGLALRIPPLGALLIKLAWGPVMAATMCVLMRARHSERALEEAVAAGTRQYVIIGAGMDSFAFRRPDLLSRISCFEIDHPVTQGKKLERIRRARLQVPPSHHFVATDLSRVAPVDALSGSAFDSSRPAFLSLLGVVYYLTGETLTETAMSIASALPAGSRLVFDYLLDEPSCEPADLPFRERMRSFVSKRGEPMRSAYSPAEMDALMTAAGFHPVEHFALKDLEEPYREEFGGLPHAVPGIFGLGTFEVA